MGADAGVPEPDHGFGLHPKAVGATGGQVASDHVQGLAESRSEAAWVGVTLGSQSFWGPWRTP